MDHDLTALLAIRDDIIARNRQLYGGWTMTAAAPEAGSGDDGDGGDGNGTGNPSGGDGNQPKPTETIDFWKNKARDQERRAKANAEKAKQYDDLSEANKTEAQRQQDAIAQAQRDTETARAENLQLAAMITHGVPVDYQDMLGTGTQDEVNARAEKLGELLKAKAELDTLKTGTVPTSPSPGRPQARLIPGATPSEQANTSVGAAGVSEAQRRFGAPSTT